MGVLKRVLDALKPRPTAPLLWQGPTMEIKLQPTTGEDGREKVLGPHGIKNFWCTFRTEKVLKGKYAGSDRVVVLVDGTRVGHLDPSRLVRRSDVMEALNSGINGATVVIERDRQYPEDITAELILGPHRYMPRPYWL